ncbi:MAG: PKD domain-containing protein [Opitutales bacterium]|nr:PKD domain-containing protein [Opitutales bacterium]
MKSPTPVWISFFWRACVLWLSLGATASLSAQTHPRLFFEAGDIPALRERIQHEPWKSMFERLEADAEGVVWPSLESYEDSWRASMCGFMYVLTGNEYWAQKARENTQLVLNDPGWGQTGTFGLRMYMWNKHVAQAYDFCHGSAAWAAGGFQATVSSALKQQSDVIFSSGGTSQNTAQSSNWRGIRYAAAGLGYLATDDAFDTARLQTCYNQVRDYLHANLGTAASPGWNFEGLGYMTFPMVTVGPFAIAYEGIVGVDMRNANPNLATTWWTITAPTALYRTFGHNTAPGGLVGAHPDFTDDNNHSIGEGAYGLSFYFLPDELIPGQVWMYDRMRGFSGDESWDNERAGVIYSILYHPGNETMANPMDIPEWRSLFRDTSGNGYNVFRNRYADEDDVVAVLNLRRRHTGGHWGPDGMSFRINGFGGPLAAGGGRYGPGNNYHRLQNTLYLDNPGTTSPLTYTTTSTVLSTANTPLFEPDGSGAIVASMAATNVGVLNHTRRWLADFDPASGAGAVFVVSDTSDDGRYWQYSCINGINTVSVDGNTFTVHGPNGSLRATVVYPESVSFNQGTLNRGSNFFFEGADYGTNRWINFASDDGDHLVVMTVAESGQAHPDVTTITGTGPTDRLLRIGDVLVQVNGNDIYRDWNLRPVAEFSGTPSTGDAPLPVFFDASASSDPDGEIVLYEWDFTNNGLIDATGVTAQHTYPGAGTYTARLRVTDNEGGFTDATTTITVTGNFAPVAIIEANPEEGRAPLSVSFDGSASFDPDGSIVAYEWDLTGDGQPDAFGPTANATFPEGTYTVTLTVVDNEGFEDTAEITIRSTINQPPVAGAVASPRDGMAPLAVNFNASSSFDPDGSIVAYEWDFNSDGTYTGSGVSTQHTFQQPGQHTVRLRVTDNEGATDTTTLTILATATPVVNVPIVQWGYGSSTGSIRNGNTPTQTVMDLSGNGVADDLRIAYEYSETQPLSPTGASYTEVPVYGGIRGDLLSNTPTRNFDTRGLGSNFSLRMQRDGALHLALVWTKEHFLNGGDDKRVSFGAGSFLRLNNIDRWENLGSPRWLVREGDIFYVSETVISPQGGDMAERTFTGGPDEGLWAVYEPAVDLNFDAASAEWVPMVFDDVTAVGLTVDKDIHTNVRHWLGFGNFDVSARLFDEVSPPPAELVAPVVRLARPDTGTVRLTWPGQSGLLYHIRFSPDLDEWTPVETVTGQATEQTRDYDLSTLPASKGFWMIEVERP